MDSELLLYSGMLLVGVFAAAVSQVMLKMASQKTYKSRMQEYINPLVICAYVLFAGTTLLSVYAYKVVPLSMGPMLEATGYVWVTLFGARIFKEQIDKRKAVALVMVLTGIFVYGAGG